MSYSKLVEYVNLSPNCSKPRNQKINAIVIHHMAGNASIESVGEMFAKESRQASSNYGIGTDGRIACYVDEENRAWTTGSREIDNRAITFEVANCSGSPEWKVSDQALEATISLCTDICRRYGFKLNYTGDKTGNLHMHKWYQNTNCPGPYLESKFPYIAEEVNRRLGVEPAPEAKVEAVTELPVLKNGSKGDTVQALQILLIGTEPGYPCGKFGVDGYFGSATESAVKKFQRNNNLDADGVVGPKTWAKLLGV